MVAQPIPAAPAADSLRPVDVVAEPIVPAFNAPLKALVGLTRSAELALPKGKALVPATANLRLTVAGGRLALAATDLEVFVEATLAVLGAEEGDVLLAPAFAAYLERLAGTAQAEQVTAYASDKGGLQLRLGRRGGEFAALPTDDYPSFPAPAPAGSVSVAVGDLVAALACARATIAGPGSVLNAVHLSTGEDGLRLESTDSFAATRVHLAATADGEPFRALVPQRAAEALARVLAQAQEGEARVSLGAGGNTLTVTVGAVRVAAHLLDGRFPDLGPLRDRLPAKPGVSATLAVADLAEAVRLCAVAEASDGLALVVRGDTVRLASRGDATAIVEAVPCVAALRDEAAPPLRLDCAKLRASLVALAPRCPNGLLTLAYDAPAEPVVLVPGEGLGAADFVVLAPLAPT